MSTIVKGNIAKVSDLLDFNGSKTVYVTVIDNHSRRNDDGSYSDTGRTAYELRFTAGMAERVAPSFKTGDPVLVEADNLRVDSFTDRKGNTVPVIKAHGIDIAISVRYRAFDE